MVYPRTHGETGLPSFEVGQTQGLSPYTRGNRDQLRVQTADNGSIPVHTGKPSIVFASLSATKVYPRTHGETGLVWVLMGLSQGLSPYTRGNRRDHRRSGRV